MPPKTPNLTVGDRLISGLMGGILAFGTMLVIWFVVMYAGGRAGQDVTLPFYWVWGVALAAAFVGFVVGPERMMDGFENVWRLLGRPYRNDDGIPARSRRRR
ncbi:hypothetical protein [Aquisphaera insulae]|uniref:hypothetical protein n=1 Tax=Aquisphaera insulae TaxID=2712864 RepID=UPI0013EDAB9D|nr:hypothetical protein [Aquisphaera insulae]